MIKLHYASFVWMELLLVQWSRWEGCEYELWDATNYIWTYGHVKAKSTIWHEEVLRPLQFSNNKYWKYRLWAYLRHTAGSFLRIQGAPTWKSSYSVEFLDVHLKIPQKCKDNGIFKFLKVIYDLLWGWNSISLGKKHEICKCYGTHHIPIPTYRNRHISLYLCTWVQYLLKCTTKWNVILLFSRRSDKKDRE